MVDFPVTEALGRICQEKLTGLLKVKAGNRESKLLIDRGDLVGAELRFGYQSLAQSLLMAGRIGPQDLDALWARGEGNQLDRETLDRLSLDIRRSWEIQLFAILRCLCRTADGIEFFPGPVQARFERVPGQRLVQAVRRPTAPADSLLHPPTAPPDVPGPSPLEETSANARAAEPLASPAAAGVADDLTHDDKGEGNGETLGAETEPPKLGDDESFDEGDLSDASDPADQARRRRQRLLMRAMENMGALGGPRPQGVEVVAPVAASSGPAPAVNGPVPQSTDEKQLADAIEKRFEEVRAKKEYFTLLGISRSASTEEVKGAFLQLAKVFHPDRLPSSLQHLSGKITAIFEAIREAYETLQVDAKRRVYLAMLEEADKPGQPKAAQAQDEAVEAYKKGDLLMKKKDFLGAEQEYQRATLLDPKPVYRIAEAWAVYMDPSRKSEAPRAKQMLSEASRADPNSDRGHYQLGVIARVEGAVDRAEKHFREAIRINPKHGDAAQELRIIEMRRKGKRGFFR